MASEDEIQKFLRNLIYHKTTELLYRKFDSFNDVARCVSTSTKKKNTKIMLYIAKNIKTDLDKQKRADINILIGQFRTGFAKMGNLSQIQPKNNT